MRAVPEGMEEVFEEFLVEAGEILERIDAEILELEHDPASSELIASIFRSMHTVKGAAGFLELGDIEAVAHQAENTLTKVRDGSSVVDRDLITSLLLAADQLRLLISGSGSGPNPVSQTRTEPEESTVGEYAEPGPESIRVEVGVLDQLLALSGELILSRNQLRAGLGEQDGAVNTALRNLTTLTSSLQQAVMRARMQPIRHAWGKFPRMVRDLSIELGKDVELELYGEQTELDRGLLEPVKDALTHLLRNALDHGIETPAQRAAAGKTPRGRLVLAASHRSGFVTVEVFDDGRGIDTDSVRVAAVRKGLVTAEEADALDYDGVIGLLFVPGFTTAAAVGNLSGRGVGLDVVKTEIERIGGSIRVASEPGEGTAVVIEIPLTLIGIPALVVTVGEQHFAITRSSVLQLATADQVLTVAGLPAVRYEGQLLPVVDLGQLFGLPGESERVDIICQVDGRRVAFRVDRVVGIEEIVVKQLDPLAATSGIYAGVSILGSGVVTLIVDLTGLVEYCGLSAQDQLLDVESQEPVAGDENPPEFIHAVLCRRGGRLIAFPTGDVSRIEELDRTTTSILGDHDAIEYRQGLLRLVDPVELSPCGEADGRPISLVVLGEPGRGGGQVGMRIDEMIDIGQLRVIGDGHTVLVSAVASTAHGLAEIIDVDALAATSTPLQGRRAARR